MAGDTFIWMACCIFVLLLLNWAHSDALFARDSSVPGGTVGSSADEQFKIDLNAWRQASVSFCGCFAVAEAHVHGKQ
jgi:hypothetical protein